LPRVSGVSDEDEYFEANSLEALSFQSKGKTLIMQGKKSRLICKRRLLQLTRYA